MHSVLAVPRVCVLCCAVEVFLNLLAARQSCGQILSWSCAVPECISEHARVSTDLWADAKGCARQHAGRALSHVLVDASCLLQAGGVGAPCSVAAS